MARKGTLVVYDVRGMNLASYCRLLHPDGRTVIDQTGLAGEFDIHLEWEADPPQSAPDGQASLPPGHQSLVDAIRTQLGLRLDPGKGNARIPRGRPRGETVRELNSRKPTR